MAAVDSCRTIDEAGWFLVCWFICFFNSCQVTTCTKDTWSHQVISQCLYTFEPWIRLFFV